MSYYANNRLYDKGAKELYFGRTMLIYLVVGLYLLLTFLHFETKQPTIAQSTVDSLRAVSETYAKAAIVRATTDFAHYSLREYVEDVYKLNQLSYQAHAQSDFLYIVEELYNVYAEQWLRAHDQYIGPGFTSTFDQVALLEGNTVRYLKNQAKEKEEDPIWFWKAYCWLWPLALVVIAIRRWDKKSPAYLTTSPGDIITTGLAILTAPLTAWIYCRHNGLQVKFDRYLIGYKLSIGDKGWRLGLAYAIALLVSLIASLRPLTIMTQIRMATAIVMTVNNTMDNLDNWLTFAGLDLRLGSLLALWKKKLRELYIRLKRYLQKILPYKHLNFIKTTNHNLAWWQIGHPIRSIPSLLYTANTIRAPGNMIEFSYFHSIIYNKGQKSENIKMDHFGWYF